MAHADRSAQGDHRTASRRVSAALRAAIDSGALAPGDKLPSERQLVATYGVARNTAREAVRQLAESGLVTAKHGRGVFVRTAPHLMRFGQRRYSPKMREETEHSPFHAQVRAQNRVPNAHLTGIERVAPPALIAERLRISADTKSALRREYWYFADTEPMQIESTYIPWEIAEGSGLSRDDRLGPGDLYTRFEDTRPVISFTREEVTARMPTPGEASGLMMPGGVPVLVVLHTGLDQDGQPFEVTEFVMRADCTGLDYTIPVDG